MQIFNYVLILLSAVLLSKIISRFLPSLSLPIVQILLGIFICLFPYGMFGFVFELEPALFFVLFLSPLIFNSAMSLDKRLMRKMFKPMILAATILVFISIAIIGYLTNWLFASIPLAAAFALAAALGPTDFVAVEAVTHRASLPKKIMSILSGESLINDATGVVCFQLAVVAAVTGSFVFMNVITSFMILAFGGLLVGLLLTLLKYALIRWLNTFEINNMSIHIFLGLITPFFIFLIAESLHVSGILAVFFSGILHSIFRDKFNPEVVGLNKAEENIWSVISFSLDGLVFVTLGTQLPHIWNIYVAQGYESVWWIIERVFIIAAVLLLLRFIWWLVMVKRSYYLNPNKPIGRMRSGLIFSISGARGAISMVSALSIPFVLPGDVPFPERDLIILIVSGVIIISLLLTNFILPLLVQGKPKSGDLTEHTARLEILQAVAKRLKEAETPETLAATEIVLRNYQSRIDHRLRKINATRKAEYSSLSNPPFKFSPLGKRTYYTLQKHILYWEKDVLLRMAESEQISKTTAEHYIEETDKLLTERGKKLNTIKLLCGALGHVIQSLAWKSKIINDNNIIKKINEQMVHKTLDELNLSEDDPVAEIIAAEHERVVSARYGITNGSAIDYHHTINEVIVNGLYMERVLIQQMLEEKRLKWKTAKVLQANIALLEAQLREE